MPGLRLVVISAACAYAVGCQSGNRLVLDKKRLAVQIVAAFVVSGARVAFGGMAAISKRANACEAALLGADWNSITIERACTWRVGGSSNVEATTSPRTVRCISVTSSGERGGDAR